MLQKLKAAIKDNKADIVILLKLRHLGNRKQDFYDFADTALAHHVDVISIADNFITLDKDCKM